MITEWFRNIMTKLFGPNWRTTFTGFGSAVALAAYQIVQHGKMEVEQILTSLALAILGWCAKDKQVTGGTINVDLAPKS